MKRKKLERLIVEIIEDREALAADIAKLADVPSGEAFIPLDLGSPAVTIATPFTVSSTVRCTCPPDRGANYVGHCPIHDVYVTYTNPSLLSVTHSNTDVTTYPATWDHRNREGQWP